MKKGDRIRIKKNHAGAKRGDHGTVHSVHHGTYYGVHMGSAIGFFPAPHVESAGTEANPDPDHDNDNDIPGSGANPDAAAWEAAMAELIRPFGL